MLRELVKRWSNHKVMVRWLSRFFYYLDRYFIARRSLPPLNEVGLTCFRDLVWHPFFWLMAFPLYEKCLDPSLVLSFQVYNELHTKVKEAVIALVSMASLMCIYLQLLFLPDSRSNMTCFHLRLTKNGRASRLIGRY